MALCRLAYGGYLIFNFFRLFYDKLDIFEVILLVIIVRYPSRDILKAMS